MKYIIFRNIYYKKAEKKKIVKKQFIFQENVFLKISVEDPNKLKFNKMLFLFF